MQGRKTRPPYLASALLRLILPDGAVRDSILGDFWEEHRNQRLSGSRLRAWCWYWRQAMGLAARSVITRLAAARQSREADRNGGIGLFLDRLNQAI